MLFKPKEFFQTIKDQDTPDLAHPMLEHHALCAYVAAWRHANVEWSPPEEEELEGEPTLNQLWQVVWKWADWDVAEVALLANLSETEAMTLGVRARALKLVYPDGTISVSSQEALRLLVDAKLFPFKGGGR